jgi:hypothetical protein
MNLQMLSQNNVSQQNVSFKDSSILNKIFKIFHQYLNKIFGKVLELNKN